MGGSHFKAAALYSVGLENPGEPVRLEIDAQTKASCDGKVFPGFFVFQSPVVNIEDRCLYLSSFWRSKKVQPGPQSELVLIGAPSRPLSKWSLTTTGSQIYFLVVDKRAGFVLTSSLPI